MKISLLSLGCLKNSADSDALLDRCAAEGIVAVENPAEADVMLVNTCGFIEAAKRESIEEILLLASAKSEGQRLVVFGCLAKRYRLDLESEIPEIDAIFGVDEINAIINYLKTGRTDLPGLITLGRAVQAPLVSAPIKIAEGCDKYCTFCVIPSIRGPLRSLPPADIVERARTLVDAGTRELMLVAQDLTEYGRDIGQTLHGLLRQLSAIEGDFWIRPLYLYPSGITPQLLEAMASDKRIVRYVDMPVQHSEDRILRAMGRPDTRDGLLEKIRLVRKSLPGVVLRTTLLVGFPGETDDEFERLLDFVDEARFERLGAFGYSAEEGTAAAMMPAQVEQDEIEERLDRLMTLQASISLEANRALVGKRFRALVEDPEADVPEGRIYGQAHEVDGITYIMSDEELERGAFVDVKITAADVYDLHAEAVR